MGKKKLKSKKEAPPTPPAGRPVVLETGASLAGGMAAAVAVGVALVYIVGTASKISQLNTSGVSVQLALPFISGSDLLHSGIHTTFIAVLIGLILFLIAPALVRASSVVGLGAVWKDHFEEAERTREEAGRWKMIVACGVLLGTFLAYIAVIVFAQSVVMTSASLAAAVLMLGRGSAFVRLSGAIAVFLLVFALFNALSSSGPLPKISVEQACGKTVGDLVGSDSNNWYVHVVREKQSRGDCASGEIVPIRIADSASAVIWRPKVSRESDSIWSAADWHW